ncbi:MAG: sulfurtransferase TusA family protein [Pseudomonadota bacterium]
MTWDAELDAAGLLCPLPVLKIRKRLGALEVGQALRVITDDPAAAVDVPHFCAEQGHEVVSEDASGFPRQVWVIRRGA